MKTTIRAGLGVVVCLLLIETGASAQVTGAVSITGVVRDTSGAVLPGVSVEASSPELIEKVRTTITDNDGQYRIIELRPGTYAVTFTLAGFSVFRREGLELPPNFTATVNVELRVGALEETVTVSGQTPLVDIQNVTSQRVISKTLLDAVPTSKSMLSIAALMPAVVTPPNAQDVGGTKGEISVRISVHGANTFDSRLMQDGMSYNSLATQGTGRGFYMNPLAAQEVVIDVGSAGSAEYSLGGAQVNAIPKDGGNRFSGTLFGAWAGHQLQADNFSDELRARGLKSVNSVRRVFDANGALGGPILQDRLWFFTSLRRSGSTTRVANLFHDANLDDFFFTPDFSRPVEPVEWLHPWNGRLTWQATSRDKITFSYDYQRNVRDQLTGQLDQGLTAIEANGSYCNLDDLFQGTWTHPHTNKLLFEAGWTWNRFGFGANLGSDLFLSDYKQCGDYLPDRVSINDTGIGFTYHGTGSRGKSQANQTNGRASVSYVTGRHNFKAGLFFMADTQDRSYSERDPIDINGLPLSYTFRNQIPSSLTQNVTPSFTQRHMRPDLGLYVQDQWTINRLTLKMGLRYDYVREYSPAQERPAGKLNDARSFPKVDCIPCWHDFNPRFSAAYDLFGDGKTAVKFGINRYVRTASTILAGQFGPPNSTVSSTSRSWNDSFYPLGDSRRGNFLPDCDLRNPNANAECGRMANTSFGQEVITIRPDAEWITGWGKRDYNWQGSVSIDRELMPGMAVNAGYYRTWYGNFTVTDNLVVTPADFDPFCITAPTDPRLPADISGQQICGFYDIKPDKFGLVDNVQTLAKNFGKQTEVYNGFDVNFAMRLPGGAQLSGGWNVGNAIQTGIGRAQSSKFNSCFVVDSPQQLYQCEVSPPYQHRFKASGSYPLPWGFQAAAVYQNIPGVNYGATISVANAAIRPSLGRDLAGGVSSVSIPLITPFTEFLEDRINQIDLRFSRIFRLKGARIQGNLDLYNVLNANTILGLNNTYSVATPETWLQPQQVLDARMAKFSIQYDF